MEVPHISVNKFLRVCVSVIPLTSVVLLQIYTGVNKTNVCPILPVSFFNICDKGTAEMEEAGKYVVFLCWAWEPSN